MPGRWVRCFFQSVSGGPVLHRQPHSAGDCGTPSWLCLPRQSVGRPTPPPTARLGWQVLSVLHGNIHYMLSSRIISPSCYDIQVRVWVLYTRVSSPAGVHYTGTGLWVSVSLGDCTLCIPGNRDDQLYAKRKIANWYCRQRVLPLVALRHGDNSTWTYNIYQLIYPGCRQYIFSTTQPCFCTNDLHWRANHE